ncbi:MAG TPA: hypothetical protein VGY76_03355 [Solirubrobacteraceae bacterium]|jgi:hypothetical protein|nr:hypothetical protein [Solirubrobacteraceae bacterium]
MGVLEAVLAVVGLGLLILLAIGALSGGAPAPPPDEDLAAPYREGLHAAIRMQSVAQDLEQQIYAEAMRHGEGDASGES